MAMTQDQALKRAQKMLNASYWSRARYEAYCGLALAYAFGKQWAGVQAGSDGGSMYALKQLKTIISPDRSDVRSTLNMIGSAVEQLHSRTRPGFLDYEITPEPGDSGVEDQVAALVGKARLDKALPEIRAQQKITQADLWRIVLGSSIVRRTISKSGPRTFVRTGDGQPVMGEDGEPMTVSSIGHGWAVTPPYEWIREPSAQRVTFEGEESIAHEKPVSTAWVKRHFGHEIDTRATMGKLLEFQRFLYQSTQGHAMDNAWSESETPAVMFSEWWFRDDEEDHGGRWPWYMICYRDSEAESDSERELKVLWFGPNPFYKLPVHHLYWRDELVMPWGKGVPHIAMAVQDGINLAYTMLLRQLIHHSGSKYAIEENSLSDRTPWSTINRVDVPILYKAGTTNPPTRMPPAPMDQNAAMMVQQSGDWLDQVLSMSDVMRGEAVKRGEAAAAYRLRQEQATTTLTTVNDRDELTFGELLTGTLYDIVKLEPLEAMHQILSRQYSLSQIAALKNVDMERATAGVEIKPGTLRPQTAQEIRDELNEATSTGLIDPVNARRSLMLRSKRALDERESRAFKQQTLEIQSLLAGQPVPVAAGQDHQTHMYRIELEQESMQWHAYTAQQQRALMDHWERHEYAQMVNQQRLAQPQAAPFQQSGNQNSMPGSPVQAQLGAAAHQPQLPGAGPAQPQTPMASAPAGAGLQAGE